MASFTVGIIILLPLVYCISLIDIKRDIQRDCKQRNESDTCLTEFPNVLLKYISAQTVQERDSEVKNTIETFLQKPCFLMKIASLFNTNRLVVISSKQYFGLEIPLKNCRGIFGHPLTISVVFIEGNENSYNDLKSNLYHIFSTNVRNFVLICSRTCSNHILHVAHEWGFGSPLHIWYVLGSPALFDTMNHPENWIAVRGATKKSIEGYTFNCSRVKKIPSIKRDGLFLDSPNECVTGGGIEEISFELSTASTGMDRFTVSELKSGKVEIFPVNANQSHKQPKLLTKSKLRVAMVFENVNSRVRTCRKEFLDISSMTCHYGLLYLMYPADNRSSNGTRQPTCCFSFVHELLLLLAKDMNVDLHVYEVEDGVFGANKNGSWNGLIGEVLSGRADIAADWLSVSEARMSVVDFTESIETGEIIVAAISKMTLLPYLNFEIVHAMPVPTWTSLISVTVITGFIIYWAERWVCDKSERPSLPQILLYAMGLLLSRDIAGTLPRYRGSQFISISLAIALLIVVTTYTALLTTRIITKKEELPITGTNDPKLTQPTHSFKFATLKDSYYSSYLENNNQPHLRRMGQFMKPYNYNNKYMGDIMLKTGNLQAVITHNMYLMEDWKTNKNCEIEIAGTLRNEEYAFALPKGSPWKKTISNFIRQYQENGQMAEIEKRHFASSCNKPRNRNEIPRIGIRYLSGACILSFLGLITCLFVLILEYLYLGYTIGRGAQPNLSTNYGNTLNQDDDSWT